MRLRRASTRGGKSNLGLDRRKKSPSALADILTPIRGLTTHYTSDRITAHITVKTNRRHWHRAANQRDRDKWTEYNAKKSVVNLRLKLIAKKILQWWWIFCDGFKLLLKLWTFMLSISWRFNFYVCAWSCD